jgi:AraC-like DNA-binding protein
MVSGRCKTLVKDELQKLGFLSFTVSLGEAEVDDEITACRYNQIREALAKSGFGLLEDKKSILVERIKNTVITIVHYSEEPLMHNLSAYLTGRLDYDYTYMSNLFSEKLGITIEKFYIKHKIERAKELLVYNEHSLTEIAFILHYRSVAHLSNQFKKIVGLTPSRFKKQQKNQLILLEDI